MKRKKISRLVFLTWPIHQSTDVADFTHQVRYYNVLRISLHVSFLLSADKFERLSSSGGFALLKEGEEGT